jgi:tRNA-specific 2-thiouridylase
VSGFDASILAPLDAVPRGRVLVAMSGGVDSSVAAAILLDAGFDVVGCFMRLGSPGETLDELTPDTPESRVAPRVKIGHQGCCSINDAADARLVAAHLGVPFYVVNFKKDFARIIDYFVDEYAHGRTPNPCVRCNDWLKFGKLHDYARQIGADYVASGHYARIVRGRGAVPRLLPGIDDAKDQSYVLFGAPRERLASMLLPIGHLEKPRVRDIARARGLPVFDKPDSQEICFVPDNDYAALVERRRPELAQRQGPILDAHGAVVGTHAGQHRFTIGQRRGVGVALGYPIYVVDKDHAANTVTIAGPEALVCTGVVAAEANWLTDAPPPGAPPSDSWTPCLARYRAHGDLVPARVRRLPDRAEPTPSGRAGAFEVVFETPQLAVAPGQAIVLYSTDADRHVLGGGWIAQSVRDRRAMGRDTEEPVSHPGIMPEEAHPA